MKIKISEKNIAIFLGLPINNFIFFNLKKKAPISKTKKLLLKYINYKALRFAPQMYAILPKFFVSFF